MRFAAAEMAHLVLLHKQRGLRCQQAVAKTGRTAMGLSLVDRAMNTRYSLMLHKYERCTTAVTLKLRGLRACRWSVTTTLCNRSD